MTRTYYLLWAVFLFLVSTSIVTASETEEYYYAIEQNGAISGYAHVTISKTECLGRPCLQLIDSLWMRMFVLGKPVDGTYRFEYDLDPADGMYFFHRSDLDQGGPKMGATMEVRGDSMLIVGEPGNDTSRVALPPGTLRESSRLYPYLINYFVRDTLTRKEVTVFSEKDGAVNTVVYVNRGRERMTFAGKTYDALVLESINRTTGVQVPLWVDASTGLLLRTNHPFRNTYLTDASIKDKVKRVDINDYFLTRVNTAISDPSAISYMKVRGRLRPGGLWITSEMLTVPGQTFTGTVKDNAIDGVFEVNRSRYDGTNGPPFPCDFASVDSLQRYLHPSELIESDDSSLIRQARQIAVGSKDAWDAATRLSRWVNEEIGPDIPGGVTALRTYQTRLGECGSHANLLAAFCRAVGIPARCVFGCMYLPDRGGAFGQHAWNEIFMGRAGWIPVDCTIKEVTYADCGHIRLGEWGSQSAMLNADTMEILEYRLATAASKSADGSPAPISYDSYVGKYQGEKQVLGVVLNEGGIGLYIPGRMIFGLKDPDADGNWFFKLTDAASVSFEKDSTEAVVTMTISERQRLPRAAAADSLAPEVAVPEECRPVVGSYVVPMQNATLGVVYRDGCLALLVPGGLAITLARSATEGQWEGEKSQSTRILLSFNTDETGRVTAMKLTSHSRCPKIAGSGN